MFSPHCFGTGGIESAKDIKRPRGMSCFLIAQNMTYVWRDFPWDRQSLSAYQPLNQLDGSNSSGGPARGSPQATWWETPWFNLKQLEPQLVFWVWLLNRKDLQPRKEWLPVEDKMVTKLMHKAASMLSILERYGWCTVGFRVWTASRSILFESIESGWIRMDFSLLQKIGASTDHSCILLSTVDSGIRPRSQGAKKSSIYAKYCTKNCELEYLSRGNCCVFSTHAEAKTIQGLSQTQSTVDNGDEVLEISPSRCILHPSGPRGGRGCFYPTGPCRVDFGCGSFLEKGAGQTDCNPWSVWRCDGISGGF